MEKKVICFAHEKKTIREFLRKILPFKCEVELMEAVDSSQVVECLNNPKVDAVVVDDGLLTDAHVEILRTAQKPVVVISNNTGKWVGVKVIPKGYTIEQLIKELEAETTESAVSGAQPVVSQASPFSRPLRLAGFLPSRLNRLKLPYLPCLPRLPNLLNLLNLPNLSNPYLNGNLPLLRLLNLSCRLRPLCLLRLWFLPVKTLCL